MGSCHFQRVGGVDDQVAVFREILPRPIGVSSTPGVEADSQIQLECGRESEEKRCGKYPECSDR